MSEMKGTLNLKVDLKSDFVVILITNAIFYEIQLKKLRELHRLDTLHF